MGVITDWLLGRKAEPGVGLEERDSQAFSLDAWASALMSMSYNGHTYTLAGSAQEEPSNQFSSMASTAYKSNGVVFACMLVRQLLFSEARFQFRRVRSGRPGQLFGSDALRVLENPWPGGTTGDLLTKIIQHADLAGNAFVARNGDRLEMLRPDWVDIAIGSNSSADVGAWDVGSEVLGYVYYPGGKESAKDPVAFMAEEVAHFAPIPDPMAQFRGMSWLTPIVREIMADKAMTEHKLSFMENGATPNLIVKFDLDSVEKMKPWVEAFQSNHQGSGNAYKTLFLNAATDATVVGKDLQQLDFKIVQGGGETRVAAAAAVPPVIVGLSEGLEASTYSNYGQARRRFVDGTMSPLWRNVAASLSRLVDVPAGAELWYDARDIPFLKEDQKDAAEIQTLEASTIKTLVDGGFTPESVVAAVVAGDFQQLEHTGLYSVQLQPPMPDGPADVNPGSKSAPTPEPASNGANSMRDSAELVLSLLPREE